MTTINYIMGYSKADGNKAVTMNYFVSETLKQLQDRAQQLRNKGCTIHKFGRYNPDQELPVSTEDGLKWMPSKNIKI